MGWWYVGDRTSNGCNYHRIHSPTSEGTDTSCVMNFITRYCFLFRVDACVSVITTPAVYTVSWTGRQQPSCVIKDPSIHHTSASWKLRLNHRVLDMFHEFVMLIRYCITLLLHSREWVSKIVSISWIFAAAGTGIWSWRISAKVCNFRGWFQILEAGLPVHFGRRIHVNIWLVDIIWWILSWSDLPLHFTFKTYISINL